MHPYDPQSVSLELGSKRWWCVEDASFRITSIDALPFFLIAGTLVGFVILWLFFSWSYIKVGSEWMEMCNVLTHAFFSR